MAADIRSTSALDPGRSPGERGHSDSFEPPERRISDGGDCRRRRRDRATRSYERKLKRDTRNMICGAHDDRCTRADRIGMTAGRTRATRLEIGKSQRSAS